MAFTSTAPGPLFHNPHICCFLRGAGFFFFPCAYTDAHTHARQVSMLGKEPICLKLTASRYCQERSWDISPENCRAVIIFTENISFPRSLKGHGLERLWPKGNVLGVMSSTSPSMACGMGRQAQAQPRPSWPLSIPGWM